MKKKKLIPKPPVEQEKVYTTWGYSFQNGGEVPTFEKGGKLQNGVMLYQTGNTIKGRTDRTAPYMDVNVTTNPTTGDQTTTGFSYKGTRVDNANAASPYVRGGRGQSQQTIDKNNQAMASIRGRFKEAKTQQDVIRLINENKIKPYEAQLLLQAIGNERSDALGQTGEFANEYKVDPETGIPFKVSNGRVTMQRNELNKLLQEKAKSGDKRFKGWESLSGDLDYETGVVTTTKTQETPRGVVHYLKVDKRQGQINPTFTLMRRYSDGREVQLGAPKQYETSKGIGDVLSPFIDEGKVARAKRNLQRQGVNYDKIGPAGLVYNYTTRPLTPEEVESLEVIFPAEKEPAPNINSQEQKVTQ